MHRYRNRVKSLIWTGWKAWKIVEKGEGIRNEGDRWEYVPTAVSKVIVEAPDLAGNVGRKMDHDN